MSTIAIVVIASNLPFVDGLSQSQHIYLSVALPPGPISRSGYVDSSNCLTIVSSLPPLFYTMSSHRYIYINQCYGMITQYQRGDDTTAE
jgi:hypothetical protein